MEFLRWLNGWKLMALAVAVGYVAWSVSEMTELNACTRYFDQFGGYYGVISSGPGPLLIAFMLACIAIAVVGLIWGLVSLFIRVERDRL